MALMSVPWAENLMLQVTVALSLCQSARIQVTLQAPGPCLFSLGMASSALSHSGLRDYKGLAQAIHSLMAVAL